jgi:hypothetical protein
MPLFDSENIPNIPENMRALLCWVNWKYVTRKGKKTKVPINSRTLKNASSTDPDSWSSFAQAVAVAQQYPEQYGIGFVFTQPHIGVDLDHCVIGDPSDQRLNDFACELLANYRHTYAEMSPSGLGVHIYTQGDYPGEDQRGVKSPQGEMYTTGRFFTVTGERIPEHPTTVAASSDTLLALTYRLFAPQTTSSTLAQPVHVESSDDSPPDATLFEALVDLEPLFTSTWEMQRKIEGPKGDNTPSAYLMSLARMAVFAHWPDQEIVRLLQTFLRKHGLPRGHKRKIERTIEKAHDGENDAQDDREIDKAAEDTETQLRQGKINQVLHLGIAKIVQMGRDEAVYRLYLQSGYVLDLGTYKNAWSFGTWQRICFEHTGRAPVMSVSKWGKIVKLLHMDVMYEESPGVSVTAETQHWINDYTANIQRYPDEAETLRRNRPFHSPPYTYLHLDAFLRHVHINFSVRLTRVALANKLRVLGWEETPLSRTDELTQLTVQKTYWQHSD